VAQGIVGLGNPGPEYRDTRHNMGARALDALAKKLKVRFQRVGGHLVAHVKWLGRVRVRSKGSAGGHNGMRSLIGTLGTDQLRRVKVGIGRPASPGRDREEIVDHVLSAFLPDELPTVEAACLEAGAQALRLVEAQNVRRF